MLKISVQVPKFEFKAKNEAKAVAAAKVIATDVRTRAQRGLGSRGALPKPKGGGPALKQTGTMVASISEVKSKRNPKRWTVKATGKRTESNIKAKRKSARARTKVLKAEAAAAGLSTRRVRRRTADTNAALAGILSVPPKDKRASAGNRASYRVIERTDRTIKLGQKTMAKALKYELRGK